MKNVSWHDIVATIRNAYCTGCPDGDGAKCGPCTVDSVIFGMISDERAVRCESCAHANVVIAGSVYTCDVDGTQKIRVWSDSCEHATSK